MPQIVSDRSHGVSSLTWLGSNRYLARRIGLPIRQFFHQEVAGGVLLLLATVIALLWVNSPWKDLYHDLFETHISLGIGDFHIYDASLEAWIHDGLMVIFFFVVGLEIKRELIVGELNSKAAAALPAIAAVGGMIVPALMYTAFNIGGDGLSGWAIPMSTDIAFAVGLLSLLGDRISHSLKVFLLSVAIVDDIGAILIIALFYTDDLSAGWLFTALVIVAVLAVLRSARVAYVPVYFAVGFALWIAILGSGVHATIAGVILGLFTPALPLVKGERANYKIVDEILDESMSASRARKVALKVRERVSMADRAYHLLHPWSSFLIVPVFALSSAGVSLVSVDAAMNSPVTYGIVCGLVAGKLLGIPLFAWLCIRGGLCRLPQGVTWSGVIGVSAVSGIGFTVSLFIAKLAFGSTSITAEAKIGILAASVLAAMLGIVILVLGHRDRDTTPDNRELTSDSQLTA